MSCGRVILELLIQQILDKIINREDISLGKFLIFLSDNRIQSGFGGLFLFGLGLSENDFFVTSFKFRLLIDITSVNIKLLLGILLNEILEIFEQIIKSKLVKSTLSLLQDAIANSSEGLDLFYALFKKLSATVDT